MSGIDQDLAFAVTRIKTEFRSPIGEKSARIGTGFLLRIGQKDDVFITNRHILDLNYKNDEKSDWILSSVSVELRAYTKPPARVLPTAQTDFCALTTLETVKFPKNESDVAIILNPEFGPMAVNFAIRSPGNIGYLANAKDFSSSVCMTDFVSFIGFPKSLYDVSANIPIARIGTISSRPDRSFENEYVKGEVVLISGLSFQGSSGSPVFSHRKELFIEEGTRLPIRSKLVGIIAGGIRGNLENTGLSYFVKSTEILKLLAENGFDQDAIMQSINSDSYV
jgi:hypothetical protein